PSPILRAMLNHYRDIVHCKIAVRSMSALGQRQTFAPQKVMSALPPKADMCVATRDDSGRSSRSRKCLICGILYAGEQEDICSRAFPALPLDNDKLAHHSGVLVRCRRNSRWGATVPFTKMTLPC